MLIFGFMFLGRPFLKFVIIGIPFWGSLLHITAAILTISASKTLHPCAVKSALAVNILGALTAAISILTLVSDLRSHYGICFGYGCRGSMDYISGILGILLVFSLLQFTTSISISVFACKATCSNEPNLDINNVVPNPEGYLPVDTSFPGHQAQLGISTIYNVAMNSPPVESPPAYTEIKSESDN
ncbi:membrane-spanning 4-domains subfamily A member 18-like isoform X2 [Neoarius graeffei]|nr:membrane-spanning 4-domains subfamily A member 18-like isoform X2 [Neoarius graeffei]